MPYTTLHTLTSASIAPGERLPSARLAELQDGAISSLHSNDVFAGKRVVLIGLPGAFTPICTRIHLPRFVTLAPKILASGFDMIACIAANDPWVLAEWQKSIDPTASIRFLADGNLEFGHVCGLTVKQPDLFIGTRLKRFSIIARNCVVERIAVEASILDVTCTSADALDLTSG